MTIVGTRPELIRLSRIIPLLDQNCDHVFIHTGQNFDSNLSDIFFKELEIRTPDYQLDTRSETTTEQIGKILVETDKLIEQIKPDKILILGDTNSALSAYGARKRQVPVYHMEAGNRCYDERVPEEINRKIVDSLSSILLPYTSHSRNNLLREGYPSEKVIVTGNPITEVLEYYAPKIDGSNVLSKFGLTEKKYFLATLHRHENVSDRSRLEKFVEAFNLLCKKYDLPIIWSVHPHTQKQMDLWKISTDERVRTMSPIGLFDFVKLEKNALCVLSDSGTVPEECTIFNIPSITLRDVTERPEILEVGSSALSGANPDRITTLIKKAIEKNGAWEQPQDYRSKNVSVTVAEILLK